jgi:hypothetical protein
MTKVRTIKVADIFSKTPGGRTRRDGEYSGEAFRDDILWPVLSKGERVIVDLSGTLGYGSSFLEEAFGGLVRQHRDELPDLLDRVELVPHQSVYAAEAKKYMQAAANA